MRLESDSGLTGFGDCAPLAEAGSETPASALECLQFQLPQLRGGKLHEILACLEAWHTPAARCALETALLDLAAQQAGVPLAHYLNPYAPLSAKVNAALGSLDGKVPERARVALEAGFSVLKLKVGLNAPEIELAALHRLKEALPPDAVLRLDANGAWSRDQAQRFIEGLAGLPVESMEEPLAQPNIVGLRFLQTLAPFPLAVDESLALLGADALLASAAVRRLVLKPMVQGGVQPAYALARRAVEAGVECVATGTVDSAAGVAAATHLAAALDNDLAHGVATASWLTRDVGKPPHLNKGRACLDNALNGLGFRPSA